jgi:arylsulfatase
MLGESINDFLSGETDTVHDEDYVTLQFTAGRAYLRKGHWKISTLDPPFDENKFELFDIESDPAETTNLENDEPEIYAELIGLWQTRRRELGIILPEDL